MKAYIVLDSFFDEEKATLFAIEESKLSDGCLRDMYETPELAIEAWRAEHLKKAIALRAEADRHERTAALEPQLVQEET